VNPPFPACCCPWLIPIDHEGLLECLLCSGLSLGAKDRGSTDSDGFAVRVLVCGPARWNTSPSMALNLEKWNLGCDRVLVSMLC
jgi:hypothetical protein